MKTQTEEPTCPAAETCPHKNLCDTRRLCTRLHHAPIAALGAERPAAVHFIGFTGEEWHSAVAVFGPPDFVHRTWDVRAAQEICPHDTAVFARYHDREPSGFSWNDSERF